jgi:DNA-binding transcriptional LysR family regulator
MLDLRRLSVLREVALRGSFSAAATELLFSPSAVSQQIAQLEREVGVTLVERKSTGVELTPAGQLLLGHANAILARAADAEAELRQMGDGSLGRLRLAAFSTAASALMPEAILAFRAANPRVEIDLVEQDTLESLEQIQRAELDVAVVVRGFGVEPPDGVVVVPLLDDQIDVLLPPSHRLADRAEVRLEELTGDPWADCSGGPVQHHMASLGIEPNVVFRSDNHQVLEGIVAAGVAVALVPRLAQPVTRADIVVKPIGPAPPARRIALATRDGDHHPVALRSMVEILHQVAASYARRSRRIDRPTSDPVHATAV